VATIQFRCSIPKDARRGENEDFFSHSERKRRFAISDGASVSFDSAAWAKILACSFCSGSDLSLGWLEEAVAKFNAKYDRDQLPWFQQAAFDRGSFATLAGLEISEDGQCVGVVGVGDSVVILVDGTSVVASFPITHSDQFDNSPELIGSRSALNDFMVGGALSGAYIREWDLTERSEPSLFCMTDALASWFMSSAEEGGDPVTVLRTIASPGAFRQFVDGERSRGAMRTDDTTLLMIDPRHT
jgi:hypothetical protein